MGEVSSTIQRKARSDGMRNRALLLDAAKRVFLEKGAAASLDEIAQAAGVGNGTLYRHYPTRAALVEAVFQEDARALIKLAVHLSDNREPVDSLARWMDAFIETVANKQVFAEATNALLSASLDSGESGCVDVGQALKMLFDQGVAQKQIRTEIDPLDLVRAVTGVATVNPDHDWQTSARRLIGIIINGLTKGAPIKDG